MVVCRYSGKINFFFNYKKSLSDKKILLVITIKEVNLNSSVMENEFL